jgi:hypothetical protein
MEKDLLDNLVVILDENYESDVDLFRKVIDSDKVRRCDRGTGGRISNRDHWPIH